MLRRIDSEHDIAEGLAALIRAEPRFADLAAMAGPLPLRRAAPGFAGLSRAIVAQQVSVASARAIWGRLEARYPALCAADIAASGEADLRACGLSGPKIRTLRALAGAVANGSLDVGSLEAQEPARVRAALTAVSGIGPWTADIYLMFHLGHADVFAPGDLALQEAARRGFGLDARPSAPALATMAEAWSPWRAVAARLLWAYYARIKTREGVAA